MYFGFPSELFCVDHLQYTAQIQEEFGKTDITLSTITLLSPELESQLGSMSANLDSLNTASATQLVGLLFVYYHFHYLYFYAT